jgi:peptidoglycan/xylan/chitin deacetylase (PgdA/CDA1 family)
VQRELILNFHGIGTPHPGVDSKERAVWMSRERFAALMDYVVAIRTKELPVVITFDDGNASDLTMALPELTARGLTATFFVCAGRLQTPRYLNAEDVRHLLSTGMKVGSHGMHHRNWRTLDDAALTEEINSARRLLEDACDAPVTAAGIPFGSYDRRVLAKLRAEGFVNVYTSDCGLAIQGAWLKPRNTLGDSAVQEDIRRALGSSFSLASLLRSARKTYKRLR